MGLRKRISLRGQGQIVLALILFKLLQTAHRQLARRRRNLKGKRVLITGGSRGLGLALAQHCAKQGAKLILCARDEEELKRAKNEFLSTQASVEIHVCDLSEGHQIHQFIQNVASNSKPIDLLINNAGIIDVGPVEASETSNFESSVQINLLGIVRMTLETLPFMPRGSCILNITSIGGVMAVPHLLPYSTSKFGAVGFSMGLDSELASKGIAVITVLPGLMRTGSFVQASFRGKARHEFNWFALAASLPGASISSDSAVRQILNAVATRQRFVVLGAQAKVARFFYLLFPNTALGLMRWVARLLPRSGGANPSLAKKGKELRKDLPRGGVTRLGDQAGDPLNENPEESEMNAAS